MKRKSLNGGQQAVIVTGLGVALILIGQWFIHHVEFGSSIPRGRAFYSPMIAQPTPRIVLHSWVVLAYWLLITLVWTVITLVMLRANDQMTE